MMGTVGIIGVAVVSGIATIYRHENAGHYAARERIYKEHGIEVSANKFSLGNLVAGFRKDGLKAKPFIKAATWDEKVNLSLDERIEMISAGYKRNFKDAAWGGVITVLTAVAGVMAIANGAEPVANILGNVSLASFMFGALSLVQGLVPYLSNKPSSDGAKARFFKSKLNVPYIEQERAKLLELVEKDPKIYVEQKGKYIEVSRNDSELDHPYGILRDGKDVIAVMKLAESKEEKSYVIEIDELTDNYGREKAEELLADYYDNEFLANVKNGRAIYHIDDGDIGGNGGAAGAASGMEHEHGDEDREESVEKLMEQRESEHREARKDSLKMQIEGSGRKRDINLDIDIR